MGARQTVIGEMWANKTELLHWQSGGGWLLERLRWCADQRSYVFGLTATGIQRQETCKHSRSGLKGSGIPL